MKPMSIMLAITILCSCAGHKPPYQKWVQLEEWDSNRNGHLDTTEFRTGYVSFGLYKAWTSGLEFAPCSNVLGLIFHKINTNHDAKLDSSELARRNLRYIFVHRESSPLAEKLNGATAIDSADFVRCTSSGDLCTFFDNDKNGSVSSAELARSMFHIADQDRDGNLGGMEFYLWEIYQPHLNGPLRP